MEGSWEKEWRFYDIIESFNKNTKKQCSDPLGQFYEYLQKARYLRNWIMFSDPIQSASDKLKKIN